MSPSPIPPGFHTLTPHLALRGAAEAIDFYKKAFGAEELSRMAMPDGKLILHACLKIGDSHLFLVDEMPFSTSYRSPQSLSGTSVTIHIFCEDVDALFDRAVKAGAKVTMPPMDAFWGDRYGRLKDPFGHEWSIATHQKDLSPAEIEAAGKEAMAHMPPPKS